MEQPLLENEQGAASPGSGVDIQIGPSSVHPRGESIEQKQRDEQQGGGGSNNDEDDSDSPIVKTLKRVFDFETYQNRNVRIVMAVTLMQYMGLVIWQGQFLTLFLFAFSGGDAATPGYIEGTQGVVRLASAFGAGWIVDRYAHNTVLRASSVYGVGLLIFIGGLVALLPATGDANHIGTTWVWYVVLSLFAPLRSFQKAAIGAVFADSTTTGNRLQVYSARQSIGFIGQVVAPLLQLIVFATTGNQWSLSSLRFILVIGIGCHIIASILCCFLDTKYNLGDRSEAAQTQQVETQLQRKREISVARGEAEATEETVDDANLARNIRFTVLVYDVIRVLSGGIANKYIGLFFVCINCPAAGANEGMGITNDAAGAGNARAGFDGWDLTPIDLLFVMLFALLGSTVVTWLVGIVCRWFRRAHVILVLLIICNIANFVFAFDMGRWLPGGGCTWLPWVAPLLPSSSQQNGTSTSGSANTTSALFRGGGFDGLGAAAAWGGIGQGGHSRGLRELGGGLQESSNGLGSNGNVKWYISSCLLIDILSFIIRRSSVQGVFGAKKSLLMDHVEKKSRGCWNAVDSIESSFWSGTAALGGYVIRHYGFRVNLQIMAWGYLASLVAWCNVVFVMARHRCKQRRRAAVRSMPNVA